MVVLDDRIVHTCFGEEKLNRAFRSFGLNEIDFEDKWWTIEEIAGYIEHFTCANDVRIKKD